MDSEKPTRKPRGFKIALIVLLVLFILFACVIYFLPYFLPVDTIKGIANSQARELAGLNVDFKNLRFSWKGDVVLENVVVSPLKEDNTPGDPLVTVDSVRTNVAITPLFSGKAVVNSLEVEGFKVQVQREADGTLNLPDFSKLGGSEQAAAPRRATSGRMALSALAAEAAPAALPPVEVHRINLKNGVLGFRDLGENIAVDVGLDFMKIEGKTLDDPFAISGRLLPYPGSPELGEIPFTGMAAMLAGGQFNPDGEASVELDIRGFVLNQLVEKLGLAELLPSAQLDGVVKAAYSGQKGYLNVTNFQVSKTKINLGEGLSLDVPDSIASLEAGFDPGPGVVDLSSLSIANDIAALRARGLVDGVYALAEGGMPSASLDFSGSADFSLASRYLQSQKLVEAELPKLSGKAGFTGKAALPVSQPGEAMQPRLEIEFKDGEVEVALEQPGISAGLSFAGIRSEVRSVLGDALRVDSTVTLPKVPVWALVPDLGDAPVRAEVNGATAFTMTGDTNIVAEIRLNDTIAHVPATPYSVPVDIRNSETRIVADLVKDVVTIHTAKATIGTIECGVESGTVSGVLAGSPSGGLNMFLNGLLEEIKGIVQPVFPAELVQSLSGSLRSTTSVTLNNGAAEALVKSEIDNATIAVTPQPQQDTAQIKAPKAELAMRATLDLARPDVVTLSALEARGQAAALGYSNRDGNAAAGQIGAGVVKASGIVDLAVMAAEFSNLSVEVGGLSVEFQQNGQRVAALTSGPMQTIAAAPERSLRVPLSDNGDFKVTSLDFGIDNLVFNFKDEQSAIGNVRANLAVDGYIGPDKRQLVNLRNAQFSATPAVARAVAQCDLGSGAFVAQYEARLAPAGLSSILEFVGLPPAMISEAAASGAVSFDGKTATTKGTAKGQLRTGSGDVNPFEMSHDLSATWNPDDTSLGLDIRSLAGNVTTASGEAVATMMAQPGKLHLSRSGSEGLLDLRVRGSAGPTRTLATGLTGIIPQLGEYTTMLYNMRAEGTYDAGIQVMDKDSSAVSLRLVGFWKGAALSIGNAPFIAEPGTLTAGIEGEFAYRENQIRLSRLVFISESAGINAQGRAAIALTTDADNSPNGLANAQLALQFVAQDLSKVPLVFPGVVPAEFGLAGSVSGTLTAGGDASDLKVEEGAVQFRNFRASPVPDLEFAIPSGAANFGAAVSLHANSVDTGSPFDIFKMLNIHNAHASLTGATLNGNPIDEMGATFQLDNGVLSLDSAKLSIGGGAGGSAAATARVNFNPAFPEATARWAVQNLPLPIAIPGGGVETLNMEGEFLLQQGQAQLPRFMLRSGTGLVNAEGAGAAAFVMGPDNMPSGLANANLDMRFQVTDLARLAHTFPGIVPDMGLAGSINGALRAGGEGQNIRISEGAVNFQNFRAVPSEDLVVLIPQGAANFGAVVGVFFDRPEIGSPYDILRMIDLREGQATLSGLNVRNKNISGVTASFQLLNGVLTLNSANLNIGSGSVASSATVDFNSPAPAVNAQLAMREFPLAEVNDEIKDFMTVQSGAFNLPAAQGQAARVSFSGFDTDEILQTLRLDNFNFATGPVVIHTGPALNAELDKARSIMRMQSASDGAREVTFSSITGTATAAGNGRINFPESSPITLTGDNTADFQARGDVYANHTMDMKVMVAGKMENLIGFNVPNIIPNLGGSERNNLMASMNASAAKGKYGVHVKGNLASPDITGIGALAAQFMKDLLLGNVSPTQIIGGVLDLGKDAPGAIVDGLKNPGETIKNAPENVVKNLGQMFGVSRDRGGDQNQDSGQQQQQQESQDDSKRRPNIKLPFGIR